MKRIVVLSLLYCSLVFGEQVVEPSIFTQDNLTVSVEEGDHSAQKEVVELNGDDLFADESDTFDTIEVVNPIEKQQAGIMDYFRVAWRLVVGSC